MFASDKDDKTGDSNEGSGDAGQQQNNPKFSNGNLDTTGNQQHNNNSGFDFGFLGVRPHDNK